MPGMPPDAQIWESFRRGDDRAFEALYREHGARLRSFLRHYLGDAQAAQDIAQEAFLALWQNPNGFQPSRGPLRAYLFGIARKRAADWWRHRAPADTPQPGPAVTDSERTVLVAEALAQLEPGLRGLLWLREVEGYSYAELAEILDIPMGTVKSRLFAAREALRRLWQNSLA